MRNRLIALAAAVALAAPLALTAQGPRGGMRGPMGAGADLPPAGVTQILNLRRQLDLTPRQVAQLDSIERVQFAERERLRTQMQAQGAPIRDQVRREGMPRTAAGRDSLRAQARARMEAQRPQMEQLRQRDSTARAAAQRILTDRQRQQLREIQIERRGFARGMQAARGAALGAGPRRDGRSGPGRP